ncbi:hypothetical protein D8T33_19270 [Vibrio vulnificus]|nr:hypothetical protein D8T33_19270 [Vibrio vulnificus]
MGANIIQLLSHSELINKPAIARSLKFAAIKKELLKRSPKGSVQIDDEPRFLSGVLFWKRP